MDILEIVRKNMQLLNPAYNEDDIGVRYNYYLETVCEYDGTKEQLLEIIKVYKDELIGYLSTDTKMSEVILQEDRIHRHDLDINEEIDFNKVLNSLFSQQELNHFEERAQHILLLEAMNMYNTYGMDQLNSNQELIKKEILYGVYKMKTDPNRNLVDERADVSEQNQHSNKDYAEIMRLGDKYGKETLPYIEHLELLQKRVSSLIDIVEPSMQASVISLSETVTKIIAAKNNPDSSLEINVELLESLYSTYDKINYLTLKHHMAERVPETIDKPTGELLMLHFVQDGDEINFDRDMNNFLQEEIVLAAKKMISETTGLPYNEETDYQILQDILKQYQESRDNPANLESRIPLRCKYFGKSGGNGLAQVITKPTTLLSVSIAAPENVKPHLNRRVAIGFLPKDIPVESIASTSKRFNSEKDRIDFAKGKYSIADMIAYSKNENNTNETLVDWTQLKPSYILVVKDKELLEPEILARATTLAEKNSLPLVIFDSYAIKQNTSGNSNYMNENSNSTSK